MGFGVGYIEVTKVDSSWQILLSIQVFILISSLASVAILNYIKKDHKNKLGSYQELFYFYSIDRSIIFLISFVYSTVLLSTSAYCLNFSCM